MYSYIFCPTSFHYIITDPNTSSLSSSHYLLSCFLASNKQAWNSLTLYSFSLPTNFFTSVYRRVLPQNYGRWWYTGWPWRDSCASRSATGSHSPPSGKVFHQPNASLKIWSSDHFLGKQKTLCYWRHKAVCFDTSPTKYSYLWALMHMLRGSS